MSLNSGQSPFADAIMTFIEDMKENEDRKSLFYREVLVAACQVNLSGGSLDQSLRSATQLSKYITDLELQHRKKSATRRAFSWAQPLVEGLMQYTNALDTMVQADPTPGALIYGGAKLVLQLANGYTKYFQEIAQMMADIGLQLQYFDIYTQEFASDSRMNGVLYNSYRDILWFWRDASRILNQRGKRFLARGFFTPFNESYDKFKQKLNRNAQNVRHMAQALHIRDQGKFSRNQMLQVKMLTTALEYPETSSLPGHQDQQSSTTKHEIQKWVAGGRASRIDPQIDLDRHLSSRHHGTCEWILNHPGFMQWTTIGEGTSLWAHAAPGAGKSVLCASIIDKLQQSDKKEQRNVIYFFCRFDEPDKCRAISALKSIALQALKLIEYIPDELYQLYREEYSAEECFVADLAIAERVVDHLLKRIEYVYIIIDGLDECQDSTLVDSLVRLCGKKTFGITKWFFSSRNEPGVRKKFEDVRMKTLMVPKTAVQSDIKRFLQGHADLLCGTYEQLDRITESSQGNFLSVRLAIDPFRNEELTCEEEFEETLRNFQPELACCWFRSLQKLTRRSEQIQDLARVIFTAVILAEQPMTFNELLELLAVKVGQEPSSGRQRTKSVVSSACSPFVDIDYDSNFVNPTLRLAHKTVGDFLTQDPTTLNFVTPDCYKFFVDEKVGNAELGKRCLTYLSYKRYSDPTSFDTSLDSEITSNHGLLKYAAVFWYKHLQRAGGSEELYTLVRDFLKSSNLWTCIRVQSRYAPHMFAKLSYSSKHDAYRMHAPNQPGCAVISDDDYYADGFPSWIFEYDNQGDDLIWGYHMFIREWTEILVAHPDKIQQYMAQVLGRRGFWDQKDVSKNNDVNVSTLEGAVNNSADELLVSDGTKEALEPTGQSGQTDNQRPPQYFAPSPLAKYITDILQSQTHRGEWVFHRKTAISQNTINATLYRFKLRLNSNSESNSDSDSDSDDETKTTTAHEPVIWFLSVTDNSGEETKSHWFHHITKTGLLQKSPPVFVPARALLLWPRDEESVLILNLNTWTSSLVRLPKYGRGTDEILVISQEYYYSPPSNLLHRAAIYSNSPTNLLTINQSFFHFSSETQNPQIIPAVIAARETTWRCMSSSLELPALFYWQDEILYAALGSSAVKILRFPPLSLSSSTSTTLPQPTDTTILPPAPKLHILSTPLCIPASSHARALRFLLRSNHAIFDLASFPKFELPSVVLDFDMGGEERWKEYDAGEDDGGAGCSTLEFLKGAYAAKEKAFSVPIRSGLDWRRSIYVTCW